MKVRRAFSPQLDLHRRLLERHYGELQVLWREQLAGNDPPERRIRRAIDAWFRYVEAHPYAWRMLFRGAIGDPEAEAIRRQVAAGSRAVVLPLLAREPARTTSPGPTRRRWR
jgi:AcrR family transcriptional regulator